jgi:hypothetical protein
MNIVNQHRYARPIIGAGLKHNSHFLNTANVFMNTGSLYLAWWGA